MGIYIARYKDTGLKWELEIVMVTSLVLNSGQLFILVLGYDPKNNIVQLGI